MITRTFSVKLSLRKNRSCCHYIYRVLPIARLDNRANVLMTLDLSEHFTDNIERKYDCSALKRRLSNKIIYSKEIIANEDGRLERSIAAGRKILDRDRAVKSVM